MSDYSLIGWAGGQQVLNDRRIVLGQHTGPTSYTQITPGSQPAQPTGGDSIVAKNYGLSQIEAVIVIGDTSGKYTGVAFQPPVGSNGQGAFATKVPLQWIVSATGAEVSGAVNLSTFQLQIILIGF